MEVIGTGFGRTGTDSMREALDILGFGPCHHMRALMSDTAHRDAWRAALSRDSMDWGVLLSGFRSCVDWPTAHYWPELVRAYPEAKVLLTWRTAESWWTSFENTIRPMVLRDRAEASQSVGSRLILDHVFKDPELGRAACIAAYEANVERVMAEVPAERLLVHTIGDGWEPLCAHLGVTIPDRPYPSSNKTADFQAEMAARGDRDGDRDDRPS